MDPEETNINLNDTEKNVEDAGLSIPVEPPSHEQNKEKLIKSLHHDGPLPNLRTYQGDVAEFIKSKDQTLSDIVLKQQQKKFNDRTFDAKDGFESKKMFKKEFKKAPEEEPVKEPIDDVNLELEKEIEAQIKSQIKVENPQEERRAVLQQQQEERQEERKEKKYSNAPTNVLIYVISLCLIIGVVAVGGYLFFVAQVQPVEVATSQSILPASKVVVLDLESVSANSIKDTYATLRASREYHNALTNLSITESSNKTQTTSLEFIDKMQFKIPNALHRSLGNDFMLGMYDDNLASNFFIILKEKDYGIAFSNMLEWEPNLVNDFAPFLRPASTTAYTFKDLIVKNKDTRAAVSSAGKVRLIYTFLDKETILITESENSLKGLLDTYVGGSTVR